MLTERQELILKKVVDGYLKSGEPIGSKWVADQPGVGFGSSTVRAELSELEELGLLSHPHTSAGRMPTDTGYRSYANRLLESSAIHARRDLPVELTELRRGVDEAMERVTQALSETTELLAIVSTPSIQMSTVRHVEVLALRENAIAVVVITSSGSVTRRVFKFEDRVDQGLVDWAGAYFNERLKGIELGARMLTKKLEDPSLSRSESEFLGVLIEAFSDFKESTKDSLYIEGAAHLTGEGGLHSTEEINDLMKILEERYSILALLRSAIDERGPFLRIGRENPEPEFKSISVVAANYGLAHRNLGTIGVIGPLRMDYESAILWVRNAAASLSEFVEDLYK